MRWVGSDEEEQRSLMREADSLRLSVEETADRYLGIRVCFSG